MSVRHVSPELHLIFRDVLTLVNLCSVFKIVNELKN